MWREVTISLETSLVELKSRRAQVEIHLIGLRRRLAEMEREFTRQDGLVRLGDVPVSVLYELRDRIAESDTEIERAESALFEMDLHIKRAQEGDAEGSVHHLVVEGHQTIAELDRLRDEILSTLRGLAAPIKQHQNLAERHRRLSGRIRETTQKDNSYAAYIGTALFRVTDYDENLKFVLDFLRKTRVVA